MENRDGWVGIQREGESLLIFAKVAFKAPRAASSLFRQKRGSRQAGSHNGVTGGQNRLQMQEEGEEEDKERDGIERRNVKRNMKINMKEQSADAGERWN